MIIPIVVAVLWLACGWVGSGFVGITFDEKFGQAGRDKYDEIAIPIIFAGPAILAYGLWIWNHRNN